MATAISNNCYISAKKPCVDPTLVPTPMFEGTRNMFESFQKVPVMSAILEFKMAALISLKSSNSAHKPCIITIPLCKPTFLGMRNLMKTIKTESVKAAILESNMAVI